MTDPRADARTRRQGSRLWHAVSRMSCASLGLTLVATAMPVVSGRGAPMPHPVKPEVHHVALASLDSRAAKPSDGVVPAEEASNPLTRGRGTSPDVIASVSSGAPLVALTWSAKAAPHPGSEIAVRGRTSKGWSQWLVTDLNGDVDPAALRAGKGTRVGTDPVWLGEGVSRVQVRYATTNRNAIARGRLELIDPGTSPADARSTSPSGSAMAATTKPAVISRAGWGADESLRKCDPWYSETTLGAVLHHTAGTNSYTRAQSAGIVRGIYAYHTNSLDWCDIGYNVLVDKYGQIFEGRYGGLDRPVVGAHTLGFNTDTFGVSVLGNYQSTAPSSAAKSAVASIMAWRLAAFYVEGDGTTVLTSADSGSRYPEGTSVRLPQITGHRDLYQTACPGTQLWSYLYTLRDVVASRTNFTGDPIYRHWRALGGSSGDLGTVARAVVSSGDREGQEFQGGRIYRSDATGTHATIGAIDDYHASLGGWNSALALPTTDEIESGSRTGQVFQGGRIYRSDATGTHATIGAIDDYHASLGGWNSWLGLPTDDGLADATGVLQGFQGGSVHWNTTTGKVTAHRW